MRPLSLHDSLALLPKAMKGPASITVGVLALQGAFNEHIQLLRKAAAEITERGSAVEWTFSEVRTAAELALCDALIIPGGESTTISLVAARSGLLDHLREFVK
jgi:5'-phosphate synthase pdxT subunit